MARAQCIVHNMSKLLMVKHQQNGEEWWCLPGGRIEENESPAEAAIRELSEECCIQGKVIRETGHAIYSTNDEAYTYLVDIGNQLPHMSDEPNREENPVDVKWLTLAEISERDRAFLWSAGLLGLDEFKDELLRWGDIISYPGMRD